MSKIGKLQIVAEVAAATGQTKADTERALDAFMEKTSEHLQAGNEVALGGIGVLVPSTTAPRTGRNPATGQSLEIPASRKVKFRASSTLKGLLND